MTGHWLTSLPPFSLIKSRKIRDTFVPSGTENKVLTPSDAPKITGFTQVSEDVDKIIRYSSTKSCLLAPWLTFLIKECSDIHVLLPSITKLVNCSSMMVSKLL